MNDREWLESLKPGDVVAVEYSHGSNGRTFGLRKVGRVTATQVVTNNGDRFRKVTGRLVGQDGYYFTTLVPPTDEIRLSILRERLVVRLNAVPWRALPLETLEKIVALLPENE